MFWNNFNSLCEKNGKTPNSVCKELGLSNAAATHWKNGTPPGSKSLTKIAEYFNVSTDYLLGKADKPANSLSDNEKELLALFRKLDDRQQIKFIGKAEEIIKEMLADSSDDEYSKQEGVG